MVVSGKRLNIESTATALSYAANVNETGIFFFSEYFQISLQLSYKLLDSWRASAGNIITCYMFHFYAINAK